MLGWGGLTAGDISTLLCEIYSVCLNSWSQTYFKTWNYNHETEDQSLLMLKTAGCKDVCKTMQMLHIISSEYFSKQKFGYEKKILACTLLKNTSVI